MAENVSLQSLLTAQKTPTLVKNDVGMALIRAALHPYIQAHLLDENLMPLVRTKGEKGMLARHIAEHLKLDSYWPLFSEIWSEKYLRTYYNSYAGTKKSLSFWKMLNDLK